MENITSNTVNCQPATEDKLEIKLEVIGFASVVLHIDRQELLNCVPPDGRSLVAVDEFCARYLHPCLWKLAAELRESESKK